MRHISFLLILGITFLSACTDTEVNNQTTEIIELEETIENVDETIRLASTQEAFWNQLLSHCGKAYQGRLEASPAPEGFVGKELKMYVMSCDENTIKIPFYVGDDRSRTWVFTKTTEGISLKHDHRKEDGTEEEETMYGGHTLNFGLEDIQYFAADQETLEMIPGAGANLWWVTIDDSIYSYNLRRVTTDRVFKVLFDLENPIDAPELPWGHL